MPIFTSHQISDYYDRFKTVEVTFTKEVIRATGLLPKMVFLKGLGMQWPCIIYSCSMTAAKVIASLTQENFTQIRDVNDLLSLRFAYKDADKTDPVLFFVSAKVTGYTPYNKDKPNLNFVNLEFTKRAPDDLISIIGQLLDAAAASQKRKEDRITLDVQTIKKLGLKSKGAQLFVQGVPRNCIIRDLSFSGAKVIISGVAKFVLDKEAVLRFGTYNDEVMSIPGKTIRHEEVEGRKDLAAIAVTFDEEKVPMEYKMIINDYLRQHKSRLSLNRHSEAKEEET
jgi:hypothetical protein